MNDTMSDLSAITERLSEYDAKQKSINAEIKKTKESISGYTKFTITKEEMQELFRSVPERLKEFDKEGQRKLIDFIINDSKWYLKKREKEGEIEIFFR